MTVEFWETSVAKSFPDPNFRDMVIARNFQLVLLLLLLKGKTATKLLVACVSLGTGESSDLCLTLLVYVLYDFKS